MINYIFQWKCYLKYSFQSDCKLANTSTPQYDPTTEIGLTFSWPVLYNVDWLAYNEEIIIIIVRVKLLSLIFVLLYCRDLSKSSVLVIYLWDSWDMKIIFVN